jgi:4-amino-4-deoxy-L-arabinose transferase-like glycosyltransferase
MIVVLLAFVVLALAASVINPLHEATDELRHYRFVRYVVQAHALPVQGELGCSMQGHHPPLFYALGALATAGIDTGRDVCYTPPENPFWNYRYWEVGDDNKNQYLHYADEAFPWQGEALAAHVIRAVNVLLGAGVVWMTWLIGRAIWPERPYLALGSAAFVAFNPMFVYMAGAINNDVIAALSGTAVTLACVRLLRDEQGLSRRWGLVLGVLYGLALMSKFNLAAIAGLIETAVIYTAWRKKQWRLWLEVNLLIAGLTLLIAGWWFARNQLLYGEPTGVQRLTELWGVRNPAESWGVAVFELTYAWSSLWGRFGYGQVPLPDGIYNGLWWITAVALIGLLLPLIRRQKEEIRQSGIPILFLLLTVGLFFTVLFSYLLISPAGPMGRFFFPALPSLAILIFYGLSQIGTILVERGTRYSSFIIHRSSFWLALASNGVMALLAIVAVFGFLREAYARPESFVGDTAASTTDGSHPRSVQAVPNPSSAQFDAFVTLRGYQINPDTVQPGQPLDINLYWEVIGRPPGNYLLFVHLIDEAGTMVAQRDTHPGLGNFPSSQWQPGDRFIESLQLYLPETAYTGTTAGLSIGLYAPEGYRLGITQADGTSLGDALLLATVAIEPASNDYPNPLNQNFNNEVRLVGYEYSARQISSGGSLDVTLYWEALPALAADYIIRVRLLGENGEIYGRANTFVEAGQYDGIDWRSGELIRDVHTLQLDPTIPPGSYLIYVALIDSMTKEPQNIVAEDGHWINDHLLLARVNVRE